MKKLQLSVVLAAMLAPLASPAEAAVAFNRADGNRDNFVSFEEAVSVHPELQGPWFRKFDYNRDGLLDPSEYAGFDAFADVMLQNY